VVLVWRAQLLVLRASVQVPAWLLQLLGVPAVLVPRAQCCCL